MVSVGGAGRAERCVCVCVRLIYVSCSSLLVLLCGQNTFLLLLRSTPTRWGHGPLNPAAL